MASLEPWVSPLLLSYQEESGDEHGSCALKKIVKMRML